MSKAYEIKAYLRNMASRAGLRFKPKHHRSCAGVIKKFGVDVVFDGGANNGQFARSIYGCGYTGRMISFEPLSCAFDKLRANTNGIPGWQAVQIALGDADGECDINISGNTQSSSILPMHQEHVAAAPSSKFVGVEHAIVRKLDSIVDEYSSETDNCFLKLDVQGFEKKVLEGAQHALNRCCGMQLELSVRPLYDGEHSLEDMLAYLREIGYEPMSLTNSFSNPASRRLLQIDAIFCRRSMLEEIERAA